MNNATPSLAETLDQVWDLLTQPGTTHLASLATIDENGAPQARVVAVREFNRIQAKVTFQVDLLSLKLKGLTSDPRATLLIWMPKDLVQLRLSGTTEIITGARVLHLWDQTPEAHREAYGHVPPPGTAIGASDDWSIAPSAERLAVLEISLSHIDVVSLEPAGHRRAEFLHKNNWLGQWLSP